MRSKVIANSSNPECVQHEKGGISLCLIALSKTVFNKEVLEVMLIAPIWDATVMNSIA